MSLKELSVMFFENFAIFILINCPTCMVALEVDQPSGSTYLVGADQATRSTYLIDSESFLLRCNALLFGTLLLRLF